MDFKLKKIYFLLVSIIITAFTACSSDKADNGSKTETTGYTAGELAEKIIEKTDFPVMKELSKKEELEKYIGIDFDFVEDICFYWQAVSVELAEVLIIIPKEGRAEDALKFAESRKEKISKDTTFYPSQESAAKAGTAGIKKNIVYYICHNEAESLEEYLSELLTAAE